MKRFSARVLRIPLLAYSILTLACFPTVQASSSEDLPAGLKKKLPTALVQELEFLLRNPAYEYDIAVLIQVDPNFFEHGDANPLGLEEARQLPLISGYAANVPVKGIIGLLHMPFVNYVTLDAPLRSDAFQYLTLTDVSVQSGYNTNTLTIGVDQLQAESESAAAGQNVTVAVFDSGINDGHPDFGSRVTGKIAFTGNGKKPASNKPRDNQDEFGHGTHVGGIIGGNGSQWPTVMEGVAPQVDLLAVKVLDEYGLGLTSNLIEAIEWVIQNKDNYNIRVANLSLGHPPVESYRTDPLCLAVRQMVEAGIVTVVSAGNLGTLPGYEEIWGGITSPGTEPSVITVGAINTRGTITHSDDIATTYSSRGHTVYDQLFKPDLVAPGNAIASTLSYGSFLATNFPSLRINSNYMYLSGSSMAAAFVSGTAAQMLEANPDLNPNLVKAVLLLTAIKMTAPHPLEQGNGMLNAYTSVKLAEQIEVASRTLLVNVDPVWILEAEYGPEEIWAGGAFAYGDRVLYSDLVVDGSSVLWGDSVLWSDSVFWADSVLWAESILWADSVLWSDSTLWADSVLWSDSILWSDSTLWADSVLWGNSILWSDSTLWADSIFWADSVLWGDGTGQ